METVTLAGRVFNGYGDYQPTIYFTLENREKNLILFYLIYCYSSEVMTCFSNTTNFYFITNRISKNDGNWSQGTAITVIRFDNMQSCP